MVRRSVSLTVAWLVVNLGLGWCAAFPLTAGAVLWSYLRARLSGGQAPFDDLDATIAGVFLVAGGLFVIGAFLSLNRALRRGRSSGAATYWLGAVLLLFIPFAWFMAFTDRAIPTLLGRGLFW